MSEYEVGDKVRISREGVVDSFTPAGVISGRPIITLVGANSVYADDLAIEVIEKAKKPLKVGDKLASGADYSSAPVGTVVAAQGKFIIRTERGWRATDHREGARDYQPHGLAFPRTVVYLPEQ